jgi:arylsulfatase A-like enzyme
MLDEWGYYEASGLGHPDIKTPNIDRFMQEGTRFTQALAGGPVCAPTRCSLLTGKHAGHMTVRGNSGSFSSIRDEETTLAEMFQTAGYVSGGFGKWGIGGRGSEGSPILQGFETFVGFYDQVHAHTYYPEYVIKNGEELVLPGNPGSRYEGRTFAQNVIHQESLGWLRDHKDEPFFMYLPWTLPHGHWGFPKDSPEWLAFADKPWTAGQSRDTDSRAYAAMLLMADRMVGEVLTQLALYGLEENTMVIVCGDNGGQDYFRIDGRPRGFFAPNVDPKTGVEFRGQKRDLYEGGLRVPFFVRWPGTVPAGRVVDDPIHFADFMPTFAQLSGAPMPETDGRSFLPLAKGDTDRLPNRRLYWEFSQQKAVRDGHWKAVKPGKAQTWELYDLSKDVSETTNLADSQPALLRELITWADSQYEVPRLGKIPDRSLAEKDREQGMRG